MRGDLAATKRTERQDMTIAERHIEASTTSGADLIASTLKGYGVTHVFFMESVLRQTLIRLEELGVKRVLAHSEAAAVYMADGYARIARRPGVCLAQSVGAANLAAACQDPFLGKSPVLALTGKKAPHAQYRNAYQEIDHRLMFEAVTKFNATVETFEQLPRLLRQALREAMSGSPGPAHLDIAGGFAGELIETATVVSNVIVDAPFTSYPTHRPSADADSIARAASLLKAAKRPVILAGGGARLSDAGAAIRRLAEQHAIPVATSLNAKDIIPADHPFSVGVIGTYSRWTANRTVHEADLVILVGTQTSDQVTANWTIPAAGTPVIQIDIDPRELGRNYPNMVSICGDARTSIEQLTEALQEPVQRQAWTERWRALNKAWDEAYDGPCTSDAMPIKPERLCREISKALPENGILVSDTGYAGIWTGALVDLKHESQDYIRAAGSLGWGFPASLGAKCAAPDRPVLCFTGDGGFWYHMSELETARRCGINTVTVINNNSGFGQCIDAIHRNYGSRPGHPTDLYEFRNADFARIAEDLGCIGMRVTDPSDLRECLLQAFAAERPVVIDVVTDQAARAPAPWFPAN
jgi:acetolactate synthase-1/2/3 large subunit